jgi:hypothetical protein
MQLHPPLTSTYGVYLLAKSKFLELQQLGLDLLDKSLSIGTTEEREKFLYPPVNTALEFKQHFHKLTADIVAVLISHQQMQRGGSIWTKCDHNSDNLTLFFEVTERNALLNHIRCKLVPRLRLVAS